MSEKDTPREQQKPEERAASGQDGQDQKPVQAEASRGRSIFDTDEHSDAPGPFGTGKE